MSRWPAQHSSTTANLSRNSKISFKQSKDEEAPALDHILNQSQFWLISTKQSRTLRHAMDLRKLHRFDESPPAAESYTASWIAPSSLKLCSFARRSVSHAEIIQRKSSFDNIKYESC
ncbi:hypothetical protein NE237_029111 [Protea cynaroides]|uniref:Uncharacterized protein n=1 Tax=Protea cynaroides TaxID=273540 RepID=A0A9Q0JTH9_9MAGN|nr:hypothetical protein NE237_029111 [Protea cynaroides]